jgi:hypothetical protein
VRYSLVLKDNPKLGRPRRIGENVFLADVPDECKVFAFYYPSSMRDEALDAALRSLGDMAGDNLFVNIGKLDDPAFDKIIKAFGITTFPVVVVTAASELAGTAGDEGSVYVRLDDKRLLADTPRTVALLEQVYALFLRGEIAAAAATAERKQRAEIVRAVMSHVADALRGLKNFVVERDLKVSVMTGTFELTRSAT